MTDLRQLISDAVKAAGRDALPAALRGHWGEAGLGTLITNLNLRHPAVYAPAGFTPLVEATGQVMVTIVELDPSLLIAALSDTPLRIRADVALAENDIAWDVRLKLVNWRDNPDEAGTVAMLTFDLDGGLVRRIADVALNEVVVGQAPNIGAAHAADYIPAGTP